MGLQLVSPPGKVEVRQMLAKLLLLKAVPKCILAYCSQTCLLQAFSMGLVRCGVWSSDPILVSRDTEGPSHV